MPSERTTTEQCDTHTSKHEEEIKKEQTDNEKEQDTTIPLQIEQGQEIGKEKEDKEVEKEIEQEREVEKETQREEKEYSTIGQGDENPLKEYEASQFLNLSKTFSRKLKLTRQNKKHRWNKKFNKLNKGKN